MGIKQGKVINPLKKLYRLREINLATIAIDHKDEDEMKSMRALVAELPETEFIMSLVKKEFQAFDQLLRVSCRNRGSTSVSKGDRNGKTNMG